MYWTQKGGDNAGQGRIFRAPLDPTIGQNPASRDDIILLLDGLPEPIDLDLDLTRRMLYWSDRGDPPRGNTINRGSMDDGDEASGTPEILVTHLMEGIGLALDVEEDRMFMTDLGGCVYSAAMDGANKKILLAGQGNLTGIACARVPIAGAGHAPS